MYPGKDLKFGNLPSRHEAEQTVVKVGQTNTPSRRLKIRLKGGKVGESYRGLGGSKARLSGKVGIE